MTIRGKRSEGAVSPIMGPQSPTMPGELGKCLGQIKHNTNLSGIDLRLNLKRILKFKLTVCSKSQNEPSLRFLILSVDDMYTRRSFP